MRRDGQPMTVTSSDALALAVDEIQYDRDRGLCLQTLSTGHIVNVPDLAAETRWDGYPAHALAHGVGSSLSVPLSNRGRTVGALNLYATAPHPFDVPADVDRAVAFAGQATAVLSVVLRQAELVQLSDQLREALTSRSTIDQALGILMGQQHCTRHRGFCRAPQRLPEPQPQAPRPGRRHHHLHLRTTARSEPVRRTPPELTATRRN